VDIASVIEPMNILKSEKQYFEETNRELIARLVKQSSSEAFRFIQNAYDNFVGMTKVFLVRQILIIKEPFTKVYPKNSGLS
jgi:hypothetical protein